MSFLAELNAAISALGVKVETSVFSDEPRDEYVVITPMVEMPVVSADNRPLIEFYEARISLFTKSNYIRRKNQIVKTLLDREFTVTGRRYAGYDPETKFHNFAVDAAKEYFTEVALNG